MAAPVIEKDTSWYAKRERKDKRYMAPSLAARIFGRLIAAIRDSAGDARPALTSAHERYPGNRYREHFRRKRKLERSRRR